jgi:hypothetical protein
MFEEHFVDNNQNWLSTEDSSGLARVEPEYYRLEHRPVDSMSRVAFSDARLDCETSKFSIQAALEWLDGDDFSGYGLAWGIEDEDDFVEFLISPNGRFRISKRVRCSHVEVMPWTVTDTVRVGASLNMLEVRRIAEDVFFLINSELVDMLPAKEVMDDAPGEYFGFALSGRASIRAHFVRIRQDRSQSTERPQRKYHDAKLESTGVVHDVPTQDSLEKVMLEVNTLVGLRQVKRELIRLSNVARIQRWRQNQGLSVVTPSLHMVLSGAPGTGKTTLARLLGRLYKAIGLLDQGHVLELGSSDFIAGYTGQTTLKVQHAIDRALGGVLFIDEAYLLAGDHWYCDEALNVLLKNMEDRRDQFAVILAGYPDEMRDLIKKNPGLRSRFNRSITFEPYSSHELLLIFDRLCVQHQYVISDEARSMVALLLEVSNDAGHRALGNGRFVRTVFERLIETQAARLMQLTETPDRAALQQLTLDDVRGLEGLVPVAVHLN